jgi:hypothetical protein
MSWSAQIFMAWLSFVLFGGGGRISSCPAAFRQVTARLMALAVAALLFVFATCLQSTVYFAHGFYFLEVEPARAVFTPL